MFNTSFDDISFERFLVVHISGESAGDAVDASVEAQARALAARAAG